jgi:hypothetical protein
MDNFGIGIFIIPTIVLSLVMLLYFYFKSKVKHKNPYRKMVISIAATAFMLNLIWEVGQGSLYEGFEYDWQHVSFCALASIADMLMVLILLFGFGLIYKNVFWFRNMGIEKISLIMLGGGIGAILAEIWHTASGDWLYAETMPLLPLVDVGLSPVLQLMVLSWLIFLISMQILKRKMADIKS